MNYSLMPTLEHMALVRTSIVLWNKEDIRDLIKSYYFWSRYKPKRYNYKKPIWQHVEDEVIPKVQNLPIPELLKKKVLAFIKPLGLEILKWIKLHQKILTDSFTEESLKSFCWTSHGTVNTKKTAEILIQDENLEIAKRYKLACIYSLEQDISKLWIQMPCNDKESILELTRYYEDRSRKIDPNLLVCAWTYNITQPNQKRCWFMWSKELSFYQYGFEIAVKIGNISSTEYFFKKLTPTEVKETLKLLSLGQVASSNINEGNTLYRRFTDVLCFLLSQMSNEQQIKVLSTCPYGVLHSFFVWPWQSFFLETANQVSEYLSKNHYCFFFDEIALKVIKGFKDYNYQMLFRKLWQLCPKNKKRYVIDVCSVPLLSNLLKVNDKGNVQLILKDATLRQREKLITCYQGMRVCEGLMREGKWDILEFFIHECISSQNMRIDLKKEFDEYIRLSEENVRLMDEYNSEINDKYSKRNLVKRRIPDNIKKKFYQLVDNLRDKSNMKRSLVKEDIHPAKK